MSHRFVAPTIAARNRGRVLAFARPGIGRMVRRRGEGPTRNDYRLGFLLDNGRVMIDADLPCRFAL